MTDLRPSAPAAPRLACIGDVHRSFREFAAVVAALPPSIEAVLQVGDLGLEPSDREAYPPIMRLARPVYFIDGNWDHFGPWPHLGRRGYRELTAPVELLPNLTYVPAGTVCTLAGQRIGCLGGAESRTQLASRHPGLNWWPALEGVPPAGVSQLLAAAADGPLDLLVTHQPPAALLREHYGYASSGIAPSAVAVQAAWDRLGRPPIVSGHLHRSATWTNAVVLGELEVHLR